MSHHFLNLLSVDEVFDLLRPFPPLSKELVDLHDSLGRSIAEPIFSPEDLPAFSRSCVDGFAVQAQDVFGASEANPALLRLSGECIMGEEVAEEITSEHCMKVWTGGMLPSGADAVVMLEYAREAGEEEIEFFRPLAPGDNILQRGEDIACGKELFPLGHCMRPQDIGMCACLGIERVWVHRKAKVALVSTGDELVPISSHPTLGQVRDANSHSLKALLEKAGALVKNCGIITDNLEDLKHVLKQEIAEVDCIVLSGGSSAGVRDYTLEAISSFEQAQILCHGVAMSPGKPLILARIGEKSVWGLPGHVSSAFMTAHVFLLTFLRQLAGRKFEKNYEKNTVRAKMYRAIQSSSGRRDYIRVLLRANEDGLPFAVPLAPKSALMYPLVAADGFVVCHERQEGFFAGEEVEVELF